jgi:hypothetical protein
MTWAPAGSMPPGERGKKRVFHDLGSSWKYASKLEGEKEGCL